MKEENNILHWNIDKLSEALKIDIKSVKDYFTDGRRISFILERRLAKEFIKGKIAGSEKSGYDIVDSRGGKWEVRSITKGGIYFTPSGQVGKGRKFNRKEFLNKIKEIKGYIVCDVVPFPNVPFWVISSEDVSRWWRKRLLGKNAKVSRKKALNLINNS